MKLVVVLALLLPASGWQVAASPAYAGLASGASPDGPDQRQGIGRQTADLVLTATSSGVKEDLILRSPRAATTYDFRLALRGLTPRLDAATGDIALTDETGEVRATIPAGCARGLPDQIGHPECRDRSLEMYVCRALRGSSGSLSAQSRSAEPSRRNSNGPSSRISTLTAGVHHLPSGQGELGCGTCREKRLNQTGRSCGMRTRAPTRSTTPRLLGSAVGRGCDSFRRC